MKSNTTYSSGLLKKIASYLLWSVVALLIGMAYVYIVMGPISEKLARFGDLFNLLFDIFKVHIGLYIGGAIALLFVLTDVLFLKKKLKNNAWSHLIRFMVMIGITILVAMMLYIF